MKWIDLVRRPLIFNIPLVAAFLHCTYILRYRPTNGGAWLGKAAHCGTEDHHDFVIGLLFD